MLADIVFLLPNSIYNLQLCPYTFTHVRKNRHHYFCLSLLSVSLIYRYSRGSSDAQKNTNKSMACNLKTLLLFSLSFQLPFPPCELYIWIIKHTMILSMPGPVYLLLCLLRMYFLCLNNSLSSFKDQLKCYSLLSLVWIIYLNHHHTHL